MNEQSRVLFIMKLLDFGESLVTRGGLYINSVRVESVSEKINPERHLLSGGITVLRVGT